MTKDEALKVALDALKHVKDAYCIPYDEAIIAIEKTLAQPEEEPVGFVVMEHQPLTDEEIAKAVKHIRNEYVCSSGTLRRIARAIEAAHGIGKKT